MSNHAWTHGKESEIDATWIHRGMSRNDPHRPSYNALGLVDIEAGGSVKELVLDIVGQQHVLTGRRSLDRGQFYSSSSIGYADQPSQESIFSFYMHSQDAIQSRSNNGHHTLMPSPTSHLSQPIYFLPGPPYPPSMQHTPYGESAELPISAYTKYIQPGPVFQTAYDDMDYSHMPVRAMRPASASSSDSPDEILMTPFMVQGNQGLDPTQYVSYIQSEPAFAPSVTPMPIGLQLNGISGMYGPSTARTSSALIQTVNNPEATEHQGPTVEQPVPPPLRRRHTDSLPFSHTPLKRTTMGSAKLYDCSPSERLRRPLSAIDTPINSLGMGFLAIDNAYVAKQRIACQGCREKKLKCTGASPVCYNCSKKGRTQCKYVSTVRRRGPGKKRLAAEARAVDEGYYADLAPGIPAQYAFWAGGDGQS